MAYLIALTLTLMSGVPAAASTTARVPSTTEGSASMTPSMLGDGGLAQYWWLIAVVALAAAVFWFILRRNRRTG